MSKGVLISLEGSEGAGKTLLTRKLVKWLNDNGHEAMSSKEPGTVWGGAIRNLILGEDKPTAVAELFLFLADRAQHVDRVVAPALREGKWVVLDRYCDSTVVYQGYCRGVLPVDQIMKLNWSTALHQANPTVTIVLDVSPETAALRIQGRQDAQTRIAESEGEEFQREVRGAFLAIAEANPKRVVVVDGEGDEDTVFERILEVLRLRGLIR